MAKIVEAVGVATAHADNVKDAERNKLMQDAMTAAVVKAQAEGITDPDEIRRRILKARDDTV